MNCSNPHRSAEPPEGGVTLLLLAVNVHRTFTLPLTTLSGRTFPKKHRFSRNIDPLETPFCAVLGLLDGDAEGVEFVPDLV